MIEWIKIIVAASFPSPQVNYILNPVHTDTPKWNKALKTSTAARTASRSEWMALLRAQHWVLQNTRAGFETVSCSNTKTTKGKNWLHKRTAAVTALAKDTANFSQTNLPPQRFICWHWIQVLPWPKSLQCLLPTAASPREAASDRGEQMECSRCVCTCRDTPLLSCTPLSPRRNRCEDGCVCSME